MGGEKDESFRMCKGGEVPRKNEGIQKRFKIWVVEEVRVKAERGEKMKKN